MPAYKYKFKSLEYFEETILDDKNDTIGTVRIKPSGILWKPKGQHKYYAVTLEQFKEWITDENTRAKRTSS